MIHSTSLTNNGDCANVLLVPYQWCLGQWKYLDSTIQADQDCLYEVAKRVALFIPLVLATFVASIGYLAHAAFTACYHTTHTQAPSSSGTYPKITYPLEKGVFVAVLNAGGYSIDDKDVILPPAGKPEPFDKPSQSLKENLNALRSTHSINNQADPKWQITDQSTEQAIDASSTFRIALNFANETHAGGGPGFHKDQHTHLFVYGSPSAKAQEESLCQRSDLMASLTQLPHTPKPDYGTFVRSYYTESFDSRARAYVSSNHLFAVQDGPDFYQSRYLTQPKAVTFITSAAKYHAQTNLLDCSRNSNAYQDAKQRIETHLLAAAHRSGIFKKDNPNQPVELILGAFGCGVFAPSGNANTYREMIATLYKELLPEFNGFFDTITFAVPTFGHKDPSHPAVANHTIFKNVLGHNTSAASAASSDLSVFSKNTFP